MSAIEKLRRIAADPEAAAREHKAAGGTVIAHLCDNVPVELISAAGAFPLRLHGRPERRTGAAERLVDTLYPPDVTQRPDFVASMLDMLLDGVVAFTDAVIVPHNRNAVQAIHRELRDASEEHGIQTPATLYLDKAWSPYPEGERYNFASVVELKARIEALCGVSISDEQLSEAIAAANAARHLLAQVASRRRQQPSQLAGSDALDLFTAYWALPAPQFTELAEQALQALAAPVPGVRLYLGGSPQDHSALYKLVESYGGNIVAEDHCWGERAAEAMVDTDLPPLAALGRRFHDQPACSIRFPFQRVIDSNLARAKAAQVHGAIFHVADGDTTQAWETPEQVSAFRAAGIPTLHLRRQPYSSAGSPELEAFIKDLAQ